MSNDELGRLSSDYRKTAHADDVIFFSDSSARSLTVSEVKEKLIKQRDELLKLLNSSNNSQIQENDNDCLRRGR